MKSAREKAGANRPRLRLGCVAVFCGPLLGLLFAGLYFAVEDVNPLDVWYALTQFLAIGSFVGILVGSIVGVWELSAPPQNPCSRSGEGKWDRDLDDGP